MTGQEKNQDQKLDAAPPAKERLKVRGVSVGEVYAVLGRIFRENGRDYFATYSLAALCLILIAACTAFAAWMMRDVIDEIFVNQRSDLIFIICVAVFVTFMLRGFASYGQAVLLARIGNNLVARYQERIFKHLMALGFDFYADARSGQLAARISENVTGIREILAQTLTAAARDMVSLVALIAVMVIQDPVLSIFAFLIGPPLVFAVGYLMRRLRSVARQAVEYNARLIGAFQETTQGIAIVKAFTMEEQLQQKIGIVIRQAEERANKIASVSERSGPLTEMLAGAAIAGVIAYGGWRAIDQQMPPGAMFSFITALLLAYDPVRRLAKLNVNLERALVNARMIYEILDIVPQQADNSGDKPLNISKGQIVLDKVCFSYDHEKSVLSDVSITAEGGKVTALVGASGSGKSTIVALLERFYEPTSGEILIDGQNIATITKNTLRQSMAYVAQQPYLFEGSIRDNLRYGRPEATDQEIEEAAKLAQAHQFITELNDGYDSPLGENGMTLSGGQRQRLSIARAIVRNAPILILDEATSALDNDSEKKVQLALETVMKGRTTIVVAHRLSTIMSADKIVVLDQGEVIEQGTHEELLESSNGAYAYLHALQSGARVKQKQQGDSLAQRVEESAK